MLDSEQLNLKERRELYKAMRSAHDGICPQCGDTAKEGTGMASGAYLCLSCEFRLSPVEVRVIRSWHEDFHQNLPALLKRWREES